MSKLVAAPARTSARLRLAAVASVYARVVVAMGLESATTDQAAPVERRDGPI